MALARRSPSSEALAPLADLPLFNDCSRRELKTVANLGARVRVASGRNLVDAGWRGTDVMVVVSGYASCIVGHSEVAIFEAGDFFGEMAALDGGRRTATVTAISDMEVLVLDEVEFETLLTRVPNVAQRVAEKLSARLRHANAVTVA